MSAFSRDELRTWVLSYAEREFGVTLPEGSTTLDWTSAGVDSVEAVALVGALERHLQRDLPSTLLWDSRTLDGFLDRLLEELKRGEVAHARETVPETKHAFGRYVNPHLERKIEQLKIDKRFVRGEGCFLYDDEGSRYIDFLAQYGALPFGHNPPHIWQALEAVRTDAEPTFIQPSPLESAAELARRLLALAPANLRYVTFANSGTEAVEAAIKLCRHRTGRKGVLSTHNAFHGKTMGALSASGKAKYQRPFGLPAADFARIPYGDIDALAQKLAESPGGYAAFIVEPIQGEGGIVVPPHGYLLAAQELCRSAGTLLVVDEVQTGLGRTGAMFACGAQGVAPDVITIAKALGGGLVPVGACLCSEQAYSREFALRHSSTFAGNVIAMRVGIATLDALEANDQALIRTVRENGEYFKARLEQLRERFPELIAEARGVGYMLGLRLGVARAMWPESFLGVAAEERELAQLVASYLLNVERVRVAPTLNADDVLRIEPPLTATRDLCEQVAGAVERTFEMLAHGDSGRFYGSILDRRARSAKNPRVAHFRREPLDPQPGDARFAFLMHPLDEQSYVDFDSSLASLTRDELREFVDSMDGAVDHFVGSEVRVVSNAGASAHGAFVLVSRTAESLMALSPEEAVEEVRDALRRAKALGAQIVGLGAYASVVTRGGLKLLDEGVALTSGNSFTVAVALDSLDAALTAQGRRWRGLRAAVVGAGGAIGRVATALLAERAERVILIGNPERTPASSRAKLMEVVGDALRHVYARLDAGERFADGSLGEFIRGLARPRATGAAFDEFVRELVEEHGRFILTQSYGALVHADVIVTATSSPRAAIGAEHLREGAVVCDLSRPRSVTREVEESRADVLVFDGGLVRVPGGPRLGPYGIARGLAYACMAETIMLALERRFEHTSLGAKLQVEEVEAQRELARKHGFELAQLQRHNRPLELPHERSAPALHALIREPGPTEDQRSHQHEGTKMGFLERERATINRFCPGLDTALSKLTLAELERPDNPGLALYRQYGGSALIVSAACGGLGATARDAVQVQRALGARSPSLAVATTMHALSVAAIDRYAMYGQSGRDLLRNVAEKRLLIASGFAEGVSGREIFDARTSAVPVSGGYRVSGTKKPCSLAYSCDAIMLGVNLPHRPGQRGIALVQLDDPALSSTREHCQSARVQRRPFWKAPFLAGAESHELTLNRVLVSEQMVLVPEDTQSLGTVEYVETGGFCWFELLACASYVGVVSGLVERALHKKNIPETELVALAVETEGAGAMLHGLAARIESEEPSMDLLAQALFVRYSVQQSVMRAATHAAELLGGMAFVQADDVGYLLACARALAFHPPSRLSMSGLLAQYLKASLDAEAPADRVESTPVVTPSAAE